MLPGFVYRRDPSFLQHIPDAEQRQVFEFDHPGNKEVLAQRDEFVKVRGGPAGVGTLSAACGVWTHRARCACPRVYVRGRCDISACRSTRTPGAARTAARTRAGTTTTSHGLGTWRWVPCFCLVERSIGLGATPSLTRLCDQ